MDKNDLVLAVLAVSDGAIHTPVQVQKLFFLIDMKYADYVGGKHFHFEPYDYGPFDKDVYRTLEFLEAKGLVEITENKCKRGNMYRLTKEGQKEGNEHLHKIDSSAVEKIKELSAFIRGLSFAELISAIYKAYPETKVNSVFRE
jgi:hypothetical protein